MSFTFCRDREKCGQRFGYCWLKSAGHSTKPFTGTISGPVECVEDALDALIGD